MEQYKAYLIVRDLNTREEIDRIGLTNLGENHVERVMRGMLINMGDGFYIDDSEVDAARIAAKEQAK